MKLPQGEWDGAQPRQHVVEVLQKHGVHVHAMDEPDWFELVDHEGDVVVLHMPNPILRAQVVYLYRRFGPLHGFPITALVKPRRRH
jgi:hypothetical protein